MRLRLKKLEETGNPDYLLCFQMEPGRAWSHRTVRLSKLDKELKRLGFKDNREQSLIRQQATAVAREFGLGVGFIDFSQSDGMVYKLKRQQGDPTV